MFARADNKLPPFSDRYFHIFQLCFCFLLFYRSLFAFYARNILFINELLFLLNITIVPCMNKEIRKKILSIESITPMNN
jgi:hypothetical protein